MLYCLLCIIVTLGQQYNVGEKPIIIILYVYIVTHYSKTSDQPGKVASPARGQLNRENGHFPVRVRA